MTLFKNLTHIISTIELIFWMVTKSTKRKKKNSVQFCVGNSNLESKVTFLRFIKSSVSFPYPKCQSESRVKHRRALKRYILHLENLDLSFNFCKKFLSIEVEKWLPPFYSCWRGLNFLLKLKWYIGYLLRRFFCPVERTVNSILKLYLISRLL